jgi:hypothetical protein
MEGDDRATQQDAYRYADKETIRKHISQDDICVIACDVESQKHAG